MKTSHQIKNFAAIGAYDNVQIIANDSTMKASAAMAKAFETKNVKDIRVAIKVASEHAEAMKMMVYISRKNEQFRDFMNDDPEFGMQEFGGVTEFYKESEAITRTSIKAMKWDIKK